MSESHSTPAAQGGGLASVPSRLGNVADALSGALAAWATRDDSKAQPDAREAANTAMASIDTMLAELHSARSALLAEIRASDDATAARVDALLAQAAIRDGLPSTAAHPFIRPGQVAPDLPAPDNCMACGQPEAGHPAGAVAIRAAAGGAR